MSKKTTEKYHRYISYFQKVLTVGVVTCHKTYQDAEEEAEVAFKAKEPEKCFFDETEWELTDTVEYNPETEVDFYPSDDGDGIMLQVSFNKSMREKIANILGKDVEALSHDDIETFVGQALDGMIKEQG